MAIHVERDFEVEQPPERVWEFLTTPEQVVECLPNARLLEEIDERTFRGEIGMSLGPIGVSFRGKIHFDTLDAENLEVAMSGDAEETKKAGGARLEMRSRLTPLDGGGTRVEVKQSISLSGKIASFARGGIVQSVADLMFGRFADCMRKKLAEG